MKVTRLLAIDGAGKMKPWKEFRTPELITSYIWVQIFSKFKQQQPASEDCAVVISPAEIIAILNSGILRLAPFEQAVTAMTFDRVVVKRSFFLNMADLIEYFIAGYPTSARTSLAFQAKELRELYFHTDIIAVGWQHGEKNKSWPYLRLADGGVNFPYNIYRELNHWFLFVDGLIPPAADKSGNRARKLPINYQSEDKISL